MPWTARKVSMACDSQKSECGDNIDGAVADDWGMNQEKGFTINYRIIVTYILKYELDSSNKIQF